MQVATVASGDVTLTIGALEQAVEVNAKAPLLDVQGTNLGLSARNLSSSTFGRITTTQVAEGAGARTIQVGLRLNF